MRRLLATLRTDVRLQLRNGFYYAVAFVLLVWAIVVGRLPELDWAPWLAPLVLGNLLTAAFYFVGGLVLLEKREGTLEAQVVTPLRVSEYLGSKVITLSALSVIENLAMVSLAIGFHYRFLHLSLGIGCAAVIYVLLGFVAVARHDSINEYIMPSMLYVTFLCLPLVDYFELWTSRLMLLHPLQGALLWMKSAFLPVPRAELALGLASALAWVAVAHALGQRSFRRFVVRGEGVR
jgi:fluoroquinolone transport system permease protein